jgi:hypothetical protein
MNLQSQDRPFKPGDVSEEDIRDELLQMENNPLLDTRVSLVKEDMSLQLMTFQEKHLAYLKEHPKLNPVSYLTNLKTMIKIRK